MGFDVLTLISGPKDEDAPPFTHDGVMVVCDGVTSGGYPVTFGGRTCSAGWFASRIVSCASHRFLSENRDAILDDPSPESLSRFSEALHDRIMVFLEAFDRIAHVTESTGAKTGNTWMLPTTLAAAVARERDGGVEAICLWVGDSRVYCMTDKGLRQLTKDDLDVDQDAMENLADDSPLSQVVGLGREFTVHAKHFRLRGRCFLFAATDGVFGYLHTPMHMEDLISHGSDKGIGEAVRSRLDGVTGDDATLAGAVFGFGSDKEYFSTMSERNAEHRERYLKPLDFLNDLDVMVRERVALRRQPVSDETVRRMDELAGEIRTLRARRDVETRRLWELYKADYMGENEVGQPRTMTYAIVNGQDLITTVHLGNEETLSRLQHKVIYGLDTRALMPCELMVDRTCNVIRYVYRDAKRHRKQLMKRCSDEKGCLEALSELMDALVWMHAAGIYCNGVGSEDLVQFHGRARVMNRSILRELPADAEARMTAISCETAGIAQAVMGMHTESSVILERLRSLAVTEPLTPESVKDMILAATGSALQECRARDGKGMVCVTRGWSLKRPSKQTPR